jgi:DNA primase
MLLGSVPVVRKREGMEARVNIGIAVIDDLKIRSRRENEVLGVCPVCGCRDANFNLSKLVWRCWHCPAKGSIVPEEGYEVQEVEEPKFDIPEIRKLYSKLAEKYHVSLFPKVIDYLKARGLTEDTINKFKLGFCGTDFHEEYTNKVAEDSGVVYQDYPVLSNRIVIPYTYKDEVVDLRGRILDSIFTYRKDTPTYISLFGGHKSRGADFLFNHDIIEKEKMLIITEGEFKALVATQHGFPVVATPGIFGWNSKWSELFKDKEVILAADNEKISGLRSPAYLMAKMLSREMPHLKVAILYKTAKQDKVDIDSIILNRGVKSFENSIRGAIDVMKWLKSEERKGYGRK